jgi:hypothetical protein
MNSNMKAFVVCALLSTVSFIGFNSAYAQQIQQPRNSSGRPSGSGSKAAAPASSGPAQSEVTSLSGQQQLNPAIPNAPEVPISLKIGSAVLTPVGFVDATEFFRSENLGSGIGGSFGSIPFSNTVAGQLTENRFTIQNSRIGMQLDDQFGANKVRGYLETDFLGAQPTNAFVTSNRPEAHISAKTYAKPFLKPLLTAGFHTFVARKRPRSRDLS